MADCRRTNSIRALRFAHGEMTQAQLAQRIGVTRQTIIAIEQGRYSPSLEMAFQIAQVFKVPLDAVFQYPDGEVTDTVRGVTGEDPRSIQDWLSDERASFVGRPLDVPPTAF